MVRARLHLICGNCGCSDEWKWQHVPKEYEEPETIWLWCGNCGTLHDLGEKAKQETK